MRPDVYVLVVDGGNPDFKESCRRVLDRVDLVADTSGAAWNWAGTPIGLLRSKPRFRAPGFESPELTEAVLTLLRGTR
jgi:hypothetical protein